MVMHYLSSPRSITSIIPAVHIQSAGEDLEKSQFKIYLLRYNQELVGTGFMVECTCRVLNQESKSCD